MAINRIMRVALKALSYPDIDMKKTYKIYRAIINMKNFHIRKYFYRTWDHVVSFENHNIPVRIFAPDAGGAQSILIFFHGGGWVTGNIDSYNEVCANMANMTGHIVVSVDYRLAPEYHFPAAPEDCYRVVQEIFLHTNLLKISADRITIIGDSAGGNLAAAVSLMARDRGEFLPMRQILIYPATYFDHTEQSPYASIRENGTDYLLTSKRICDYMALYMASDKDLKNPYFAPLASKNFSLQPKTLIITAEYDPLRDEGEDYGMRLKSAGNEVEVHRIPDALHGFFSLPSVFPQVRECYRIINDFLSEGSEQ
nr:alpha/beta hydrolase [uncultured Caproiciproducens sp.]